MVTRRSSAPRTRIVIEMTQKGGRQKADPLTTNAKPSRQDGESQRLAACTLNEEQTAVTPQKSVQHTTEMQHGRKRLLPLKKALKKLRAKKEKESNGGLTSPIVFDNHSSVSPTRPSGDW